MESIDGSADSSQLADLAAVLDRASAQESRYQMVSAAREQLGLPTMDFAQADLTDQVRAVLWALDYHVEVSDDGRARRIRIVPRFEHDGGSEPPQVVAVPDAVVAVWTQLADFVSQPAARALLHHLLFERGGPDRRANALLAARAYIESGLNWERPMDSADDLSRATRLARAVGDSGLAQESLDRMVDLVEDQLTKPEPLAGVIGKALAHLVGEPGCPGIVDTQLDRASQAWPDPHRRDGMLSLMLKRCATPECRDAVWQRRVEVFIVDAADATSALTRSVRLQEALRLAEQSGDGELKRRAASALQAIRNKDLGMATYRASSRQYQEQFDQVVDAMIAGDSWQQALVTFAQWGPPSGDPDQNREQVRAQHRMSPLLAVLPTLHLSPEGLPLYSGTSAEDRFQLDLVAWEVQLIRTWIPPIATALNQIPVRHHLPSLAEIGEFLAVWPATTPEIAAALARSLLRFWTGDGEGAAYTVMPRIEALLRNLVLARDRGIFRLQRDQKPGQYAGLGVLLPILEEEYSLPESWMRFLLTVLREPGGMNLRNHMLHGYLGDSGDGFAALTVKAALFVATIDLPSAPLETVGDLL